MKRRVESANELEGWARQRSSPFFSSKASKSGPLRNPTGFSLLELSVVLAIVAVLTAGAFSMGSSMVESVRKVNTWNKLDTIEEALLAFRLVNNRLPCPGDATLTDIPANANSFGWEAGYATPNSPDGTCSGGSPRPNFTYSVQPGTLSATTAPITSTVVEGAVPVRSLSLPDEFQFDGWGRKFGYAVWTPLTATRAFLTYGLSPNCGAITVENAGHGYRSTAAAYALISYGPDGHGGYLKSGSPTRYNAGSDNADEIINAHYSAAGVPTSYAATYIEKDWTQDPGDSNDNFDDTVRFKERWQMQNAYDTYVPNGWPCIPGFRIDGDTTNGNIGGSDIAFADLNGDGIPDLLILGHNGTHYNLYVIFGQPSKSSFSNPFVLNSTSSPYNPNGTNGFILTHIRESMPTLTVADLNGDGIQDVVIKDANSGNNGVTYIVFGQSGATWPSTPTNINTLSNTTTPQVTALPGMYSWGAIAIGDINGDGINDVITSQDTTSPSTILVFFGHPTQAEITAGTYPNAPPNVWPSSLTTASLTGGMASQACNTCNSGSYGHEGFTISGQWGWGSSMAIGDFNKDGIKDLLIANNGNAQAAAIIWGQSPSYSWPATLDPDSMPSNGSEGLTVTGCGQHSGSPCSLYYFDGPVAAGDINGDGIDDAIILGGGYESDSAAYLLYGASGSGTPPWPSTWNGGTPTNAINLQPMPASGATRIDFPYANPFWGGGGMLLTDITGDGKKDLIIQGVDYGDGSQGAGLYVFEYKAIFNNSAFGTSLGLGTYINGYNGFAFTVSSPPWQQSAYVSSFDVADLNADGINDLVVTNAQNTANSQGNAGSTWVIWGKSNSYPYSNGHAYPNSGVFDDTSTYQGSAWIRLDGTQADGYSGSALAVGDLDHDGNTDIAIAAPGNTPSSNNISGAGSVYVIWGGKNLPSEIPSGANTLENMVNR